jgi:hypothetical protein
MTDLIIDGLMQQ